MAIPNSFVIVPMPLPTMELPMWANFARFPSRKHVGESPMGKKYFVPMVENAIRTFCKCETEIFLKRVALFCLVTVVTEDLGNINTVADVPLLPYPVSPYIV